MLYIITCTVVNAMKIRFPSSRNIFFERTEESLLITYRFDLMHSLALHELESTFETLPVYISSIHNFNYTYLTYSKYRFENSVSCVIGEQLG